MTLHKTYCSLETATTKIKDLKKVFVKKRKPSFEQKIEKKMDSLQNSNLNSENIKHKDKKVKELSKELLDILNVIYQLLIGENNCHITEKLKGQINSEEILEVYKKYITVTEIDNNENVNLHKLFKDLNLNFHNVEDEFNLSQLSKLIDNEKITMDKLKPDNLMKFFMRKFENNKEEIINYKPINIISKSKNIDEDLLKEKTISKEEKFLKILIDDTKKENKVSNINISNNFFKIHRNTPVEIKEVLTLHKSNIVNDMVKSIKYMEINNLKELIVKVNPKELGEIVINLTMDSGKFKLSLDATSKETYKLIDSNLIEISEKLNNANIKIKPEEINVYNSDTKFFSGQFTEQNSNKNDNNRKHNRNIQKDTVIESNIEEKIFINQTHVGNLNAKV